MTPAPLLARLDELQGGLEGLLSCFEAQRFPEPGQIDATWLHVQRGFEGVRGELDGLGRGHEELRARAQERVEHCLRLYAVAASVLARRRSELAAEHLACSDARQRLRRLRPEGRSGGSCDVRA